MASPVSLLLPLLAQLGGVQWGDHEPFERPAGSALGDMLGNIGDWDGGGFDEIAMAVEATNELHIISSATRQTLQVIDMYARFGETGNASKIVRMGDLNGDGIEEFVFSFKRDLDSFTWDKHEFPTYRGSIHLVDGQSLSAIWSGIGQSANHCLGHVVQRVEDRDGDGKADLLVSVPHTPRARIAIGYVAFVSSATGQTLDQITRAGKGAGFGEGAILTEDLNGDGEADLIASAPAWGTDRSHGKIYAIDLQSKADIWTIEGPINWPPYRPASLGRWLLQADDLDGDGVNDLFAGSKNYRWALDGKVQAISAATGTVLWSIDRGLNNGSVRSWGALCVTTPDLDNDGVRDFIARHGQHGGTLEVHSGISGDLIHATEWWGTTWGLRYDWHENHSSVVEVTDLNGDGYPEYLSMIEHPDELGYPNARTMSFFRCLEADTTEISRSAGTTVQLELAFPWAQHGLNYVIAASATGSVGGPFRNIDLPLDPDALFARSKDPARPLFPGQWGQLDANGRASITVNTAGLIGSYAATQLHFSAVAYDAATARPSLASRAWTFDIVP